MVKKTYSTIQRIARSVKKEIDTALQDEDKDEPPVPPQQPCCTVPCPKMVVEDVTSDWLKKELSNVEESLAKNERKRHRQEDHEPSPAVSTPPLQRLAELNAEVDSLELAHDVSIWASGPEPSSLMEEAQRCADLGQLLCRHKVISTNTPRGRGLYDTLRNEEYEPLHRYVRAKIIMNLRRSLRQVGYPSEEGCSKLLEHCQDFDAKESSVPSYCFWLSRLQQVHTQVMAHTEETMEDRNDVIVELCRPLVEKVRFHFVQPSKDRKTSTRIERLPEWVLNYLRENAIDGGPFDFVVDGMTKIVDDAPIQFLTEIVQMAQYVLVERNFFRHELIAGPRSNPMHLMHGIEQLLSFDSYLQELLPDQRVPVRLSQALIASDAALWKWWLDRERESTLSAMFETEITERPPNRISPRAELFCSLIHSIKSKASLFDSSREYVSQVAVPLCMNYLDAVHATATDLRNLLSQRKLPSDEDLKSNIEEWIDLINGVHLASITLHKRNDQQVGLLMSSGGSDHDLARVGRSFERLREVMVEECATTIVETVLMERAKLASYLLRASHLLASHVFAVGSNGLSPDLNEVSSVFSVVIEACDAASAESDETDQFAPAALRANVADRAADKFLEVILDAHGMTPELSFGGCLVVADDVNILFAGLDSPLVCRLFDVVGFMTMRSEAMHTLRMALFGLEQTETHPDEVPILHFAQITSDGTLLDEALNMLQAKGHHVHLEDAISVLNRRKDSFL